jgi:hypothetical protein
MNAIGGKYEWGPGMAFSFQLKSSGYYAPYGERCINRHLAPVYRRFDGRPAAFMG